MMCQNVSCHSHCVETAYVWVLLVLQDAQGQNLCQYREFEPSEAGDSDADDSDWHAQKKGCCTIM